MFLVAQLVRRLPVNLKVGVQTPPMPKILLLRKCFLGKFVLRLSRNLDSSNFRGMQSIMHALQIQMCMWFLRFKYFCTILDVMHILDDDKQFIHNKWPDSSLVKLWTCNLGTWVQLPASPISFNEAVRNALENGSSSLGFRLYWWSSQMWREFKISVWESVGKLRQLLSREKGQKIHQWTCLYLSWCGFTLEVNN